MITEYFIDNNLIYIYYITIILVRAKKRNNLFNYIFNNFLILVSLE